MGLPILLSGVHRRRSARRRGAMKGHRGVAAQEGRPKQARLQVPAGPGGARAPGKKLVGQVSINEEEEICKLLKGGMDGLRHIKLDASRFSAVLGDDLAAWESLSPAEVMRLAALVQPPVALRISSSLMLTCPTGFFPGAMAPPEPAGTCSLAFFGQPSCAAAPSPALHGAPAPGASAAVGSR